MILQDTTVPKGVLVFDVACRKVLARWLLVPFSLKARIEWAAAARRWKGRGGEGASPILLRPMDQMLPQAHEIPGQSRQKTLVQYIQSATLCIQEQSPSKQACCGLQC